MHFEIRGTPFTISGKVLVYTHFGAYYIEAGGDCAILIIDPQNLLRGSEELMEWDIYGDC